MDVDIYTAQYRYKGVDRLDITVKGNDPIGRVLAPTWGMVKEIKAGTMSQTEYIWHYLQKVERSRTINYAEWIKPLEWAQHLGTLTLVCFCPPDSFCHRIIAANYLCSIMNPEGHNLVYKGERY